MTGGKVFIETYGCAFNIADSEAMAGVLTRAGFEVLSDPARADVIILNTCTVKDRTYAEFEKRFRKLQDDAEGGRGPRLIVAGCIPKAARQTDLLAGVATLGPDSLGRVAEVVGAVLGGREVIDPEATGEEDEPRVLLPRVRRRPSVEILPIAAGCLSACAFCQTRLARGRLRSFQPGDIVARARQALAEGARELWLTAQDTGAYGKDVGESLPDLIESLCALEGDFRIRLGMSSPAWILEDLDRYLELLDHPKMFRFLHVPVQSGSDRILRAMRRANTAADFIQIAGRFHARFPEGLLMTDVIVGFPGEDEADFTATLTLLDRARPALVNRSKFSARPGTAAARLRPVPGRQIRERSRRLMEAAGRLARDYHAPWVGRSQEVLACDPLPGGSTLSHNINYATVIVNGSLAPGVWVHVKYCDLADYHLCAERLK